jgi:hypothetical protein
VGQKLGRAVQPGALPGDPVVLSFAHPVADFALATDAQRVLQGVVRFALVEPDLGANQFQS